MNALFKDNSSFQDICLKLRKESLALFYETGEGHIGGAFSIIEILIALYGRFLEPQDKFILSKSHASYPFIALLRWLGYAPKLTTHLERDEKNGIFCTTGSLGHGLPISVGMALGRKISGVPGKIFVLLSDGECQEGTTWESILVASARKLDNLVLIIDYNKIQATDFIDNVLPLGDLRAKFEAFGLDAVDVIDGHSLREISSGFEAIFSSEESDRPKVLVLHTVKGKGCEAIENRPEWHARKIRDREYKAIGETLERQ